MRIIPADLFKGKLFLRLSELFEGNTLNECPNAVD
jgi:hypothetical protein